MPYTNEWNLFMDGNINAAEFVAMIATNHNLSYEIAKQIFDTLWNTEGNT